MIEETVAMTPALASWLTAKTRVYQPKVDLSQGTLIKVNEGTLSALRPDFRATSNSLKVFLCHTSLQTACNLELPGIFRLGVRIK